MNCRFALCLLLLLCPSAAHAYTTYANWAAHVAVVYLNPAHAPAWMTPDQVEASIKASIDDWNTQGGANVTLIYGGRTTAGRAFDGLNVVSFSATPHPQGVIAFTYSQWDADAHLLDSDTVFYPPYQFFADDQACPYQDGNVVLHDLSTHELGHMLGLNHSTDGTATMYGAYFTCSTTQRTLEADDKAGLQALYGTLGDPIPDPTIPPPPPLGCTIGDTITQTLRNGQAGAWIDSREADGYVLMSSVKVKGSTTVTMQCGAS